MAVFHEEVDAVLFEGDGVGSGLGDALDDLDVFDVELEAAGGALVGTDFAGDDDGGFLGEAFEGFKHVSGHAFDVGYALDGSGAVAEDWKEELAAFAEVVEPAAEGDGLAFMLAEGGDGGDRRHLRWGRWRRSGFRSGGCDFFGHGLLALWAV
jgi:hypothetical protein